MTKSKSFLAKFEHLDICERDTDLVPFDPDSGEVPTGYWATRGAIRSAKKGVNVYKNTKLGRLNRQIDDLRFQKKKVRQTAKLDKEKHAKSMWARRKEKLLKQKLGIDPEGKLYKVDVEYKAPRGKPGRYSQQNRQAALSGRQRAHQSNYHVTAQPVDRHPRLALQNPDYDDYMDTDQTDFGSRSRASRMSRSIGPKPARLPRGKSSDRVARARRVGPGSGSGSGSRRLLLTQGS